MVLLTHESRLCLRRPLTPHGACIPVYPGTPRDFRHRAAWVTPRGVGAGEWGEYVFVG